MTWDIGKLERRHDRSAFDCGHPSLNAWLKERAGQFERRDLARTYVAVRPGDAVVRGYFALSNHKVSFETLTDEQAKGLPRMDVPVVLLGRLAVDRTEQGKGLGSFLLVDALRRAEYLSQRIGVRAVEVDAIDETAKQFYLGFGFVPMRDDKRHLFLPMHIIRKLALPPGGPRP